MFKPAAAVGAGIGLLLWVLEMAEIKLPPLLLWILGLLATAMVLYGISPWGLTIYRMASRIHLRSPFFFLPAKSQANSNTITIGTDTWAFSRTSDGHYVGIMGTAVKILLDDAYDYYRALRDTEQQIIHERWRRLRKACWSKDQLFEIRPMYTDPDGIQWRKPEISELPDPAQERLKRDRPDVWGFYLDDPDFRSKYPGRLPYERR